MIPAKGDLTAELFTDEEFKMDEEHDVAQYDLVPQNAQAPVNVCYAQSFAVVKYVNARRASHGAVVNVPTLLEKFVFKTLAFLAAGLGMENIPLAQGTDVCNTPGFSADETGSNNYLSWSLLLLFLGLVILTLWFALRRSVRRLVELDYQLSTARQQIALLERDLAEAEGRQATVEDERSLVMRNSNVLSVMHGELQQAHERRTQAHDRARRAFAEQRDAEVELRNALRLSAPELQTGFEAAHALEVHFERCPLGGMISIQDGARSWHTDSDCPELYVSGREIQNRVPCPFCAQTPRDPDDLNAGLRVIHAPDGVQLENLRPLQTNSSPRGNACHAFKSFHGSDVSADATDPFSLDQGWDLVANLARHCVGKRALCAADFPGELQVSSGKHWVLVELTHLLRNFNNVVSPMS